MFFTFFLLFEKDDFSHWLTTRASRAPMTSTCDEQFGNERCKDMLVVVSGWLRTYRNPGRKCDSRMTLTSETYSERSGGNAAAVAHENMVPMVSVS